MSAASIPAVPVPSVPPYHSSGSPGQRAPVHGSTSTVTMRMSYAQVMFADGCCAASHSVPSCTSAIASTISSRSIPYALPSGASTKTSPTATSLMSRSGLVGVASAPALALAGP